MHWIPTDSAQLYDRCIKAASAPAYREIRETLNAKEDKTVEDYREAVRVLALIQDYSDAREFMRGATSVPTSCSMIGRWRLSPTRMPRRMKSGRLWRYSGISNLSATAGELLERYDKYYCERVYAEASELMQRGTFTANLTRRSHCFPAFRSTEMPSNWRRSVKRRRINCAPGNVRSGKSPQRRRNRVKGSRMVRSRPREFGGQTVKDRSAGRTRHPTGFLRSGTHWISGICPCALRGLPRLSQRWSPRSGIENADCVGKKTI